MKRKDLLIGILALSLLAAVTYRWLTPAGITVAPDITLSTIHGEKIALSALRGRPVLVNFWATTCPGCIREMPQLAELYRELGPKGLEVIGIAMPYDPPNLVISMRDARHIPYPIALDINGDAVHAFGDVRLTPSSFLIAPDGRIVQQKTGAIDSTELRAVIVNLLAQSLPPQTLSRN